MICIFNEYKNLHNLHFIINHVNKIILKVNVGPNTIKWLKKQKKEFQKTRNVESGDKSKKYNLRIFQYF